MDTYHCLLWCWHGAHVPLWWRASPGEELVTLLVDVPSSPHRALHGTRHRAWDGPSRLTTWMAPWMSAWMPTWMAPWMAPWMPAWMPPWMAPRMPAWMATWVGARFHGHRSLWSHLVPLLVHGILYSRRKKMKERTATV